MISRPSSVEAPGYSIPNSSMSPSILRLSERPAMNSSSRPASESRKAAMRKAASEIPDEKAWLVFLPRKDREELGLSFDIPKSN